MKLGVVKSVIGCAMIALSVAPQVACALDLNWTAAAMGVAGKPSAYGGETFVTGQFRLLAERAIWIGPKAGALIAWADADRARFDLNWGISETTWFVNAIGSGLDLEVVVPSTITGEESSVHFRIVPNLAVRAIRLGEEGALAVRLGVPYDTRYKWGIQAGVTFQFNGVPQVGPDLEESEPSDGE